jgi:hypothetical protein
LKRDVPEQLLVAAEPRCEGETLDRAAARCLGVALTVGQHLPHRPGERLWGGRLVAFPALGMWDANPGFVANELDGAAARRVDDR